MGATGKKAAAKSTSKNKSATKKAAPKSPVRRLATRKTGSAARARVAKPGSPAKKAKPAGSAARPAAKKTVGPKDPAAAHIAQPVPLNSVSAGAAVTPVAELVKPPAKPGPAPRPMITPASTLPMPPGPKPNLVKLSSLEPADAARLTAVRNLLEAQGRHDLPGVLACFSTEPTLEFAGGPRHVGVERVSQILGDMLRAFPDLATEVTAEHVADRSIVVEMILQGTHRQQWLGMAPRGRTLSLPVCSVFLFDKRDHISALRIYLDRNLAIVQLTSGLLR
jgi:hypothetical protein